MTDRQTRKEQLNEFKKKLRERCEEYLQQREQNREEHQVALKNKREEHIKQSIVQCEVNHAEGNANDSFDDT